MSMRFGKRKSRGIEQILSFVEASILIQVLHFSEEDLKDLEKELVRYNKRLQDYFEQHDDKQTYKDLVSEFKEEQAHCRTLQDTSDGGSMIAWVLNKGEDQGVSGSFEFKQRFDIRLIRLELQYPTPWEHNPASSHAAIPSSSSHSLDHRLTSRQKKVYYDC